MIYSSSKRKQSSRMCTEVGIIFNSYSTITNSTRVSAQGLNSQTLLFRDIFNIFRDIFNIFKKKFFRCVFNPSVLIALFLL